MNSGTRAAAAATRVAERVAALAREKFARRADRYDREGRISGGHSRISSPPAFMLPACRKVSAARDSDSRDVYALWLMTKEIAKADMSMALLGGHVNSQVLIDAFGTEEQEALV
mgnify:CR=1 FL=1